MSQHSHECYTDVFLTAHPKDGLHSLQEKQRQGHVLDDELAQYFKERALIEDQYAKSLVKASKRLYVMDSAALGGFAPIWKSLLNELTEISNVHGVLAYRITDEIEKVLRMPASTDVDKIKALEPTFQQISKDYEAGLKTKKSGKSSLFKSTPKVQSEKVLSKWTTDGPALLQLYENVERARLQRLKSLVETFEHIHKDQFEQRIQIANDTLSSTNSFDVDTDIRHFCNAKKNHLTAAVVPTTTTSTPSTITIDPSDQVLPMDLPRPMNEKKQRSRFSLLRKSKKTSTQSLKSREPYTISSIPEHSDTQQQSDRPDSADDVSEAVPNSAHSANSHRDLQHSPTQGVNGIHHEVPNGSNLTRPPAQQSPSSPFISNTSATTTNNAFDQAPPVDAEGYSIPFPDTFGQSTSGDGVSLNDSADFDSSSHFGSQKLKFDIKDKTVVADNPHLEQEKATLTRISSLLRENTPTTSPKRRGRRTNMRAQSHYWESGPPSPLSSINERGSSSINVGSTISSTSSNDNVINPFRHSTVNAPNDDLLRTSPSPASSHDKITALPSSSHHPTLLATIVETVNVQHPGDAAEITGHIKMAYDGPILRSDTVFMIRLGKVENIQPLHALVQPVNSSDSVFTISMRVFPSQDTPTFTSLFTYHRQETALNKILPFVAEPAWKTSDTSTMLMVKYTLTDRMAAIPDHGQLRVLVHPGRTSITKAQSTPEGAWDQQQQLFTWNASEIITHQKGTSTQPPRLLAKFIGGEDSSPPSLSLKYYCRGALASGIDLETWVEDKTLEVRTQIHQCITKSGTILLA
ncbi:hypothetical protein [Absidia glauca]|uniref:FCH domain-containing protein n=1 Tax=Absidia glauca TaxID=4829 RepID=A0A163M8A1_ABSGL|nr:hypothetical protein [Absidia glauca]